MKWILNSPSRDKIRVFTTRPDTLFGATYMVLSPEEHKLVTPHCHEQKQAVEDDRDFAAGISVLERTELAKERTGVTFTGSYAINPVNSEKIPIWIAVRSHELWPGCHHGNKRTTRATLTSPKILTWRLSSCPATGRWRRPARFHPTGASVIQDSLPACPPPKPKIAAWLEEKVLGKKTINYKLRDWLFSRLGVVGRAVPDCSRKKDAAEIFILKRCRRARCPGCHRRWKITSPPPVASRRWPAPRTG